jgi:hypothetical protein
VEAREIENEDIFSRRDAEAQRMIKAKREAIVVWNLNPPRLSGSAGKNSKIKVS